MCGVRWRGLASLQVALQQGHDVPPGEEREAGLMAAARLRHSA